MKFNCCVPGCTNSHRNKSPDLKFYCLPKDQELRKTYDVLLKNDSLKIDSRNTRICSEHWEGGEKLSRTHLPSIFPWSVSAKKRREIYRKTDEEISSYCKKRRTNAGIIESVTSSEMACGESIGFRVAECVECPNHTKDVSVQTEIESELLELRNENAKLRKELEEAKNKIKIIERVKNDAVRFDIERYKNSDKDIEFFTGFSSYNMLLLCYEYIKEPAKNISYGNHERINVELTNIGRPRSLTSFQEFVLVLMRLRLGLFERDLAHRFLVSESTVSVIVRTWLKFLSAEFKPLIKLPPRDVIRHHSPKAFKELFPKVSIIIDCTEVEMERPSALDSQSVCYSSYKSRPTMKALVGITPSGALAYVSEFFPGSTSDKEITLMSGLLSQLLPGDEVMADKGFNIQDELAAVGVSLVVPAFLKGKTQFTVEESTKNKTIASLRIHVERMMERLKNWHVLDRKLTISMAPLASDMIIVISALSNFLPPLIH